MSRLGHTRMVNGPTHARCLELLDRISYDGPTSFTASELRPLTAWVAVLTAVTGRPVRWAGLGTKGVSAWDPVSMRERDLIDARYLAAILASTVAWEQETGQPSPIKPVREAIWFTWQAPRRPGPLVRSKYPAPWPWSAAARDAYFDDPRHCALVVEHTEPLARVVRDLLEGVPWEPAALAETLYGRLACVMLTKAEDRLLTAAGVGSSTPPESAVSRYVHAGIDEAAFLPLVEDPRWRGQMP